MADTATSSVIGKLRYSCKYPSCKNSYYHPVKIPSYHNKKFHRFPRDPESLQIWKNTCNISPNVNCKNFFLCDSHFIDADFACPQIRNRILPKTVPKPSVHSSDEPLNCEVPDKQPELNELPSLNINFSLLAQDSPCCSSSALANSLDDVTETSNFDNNSLLGEHSHCKIISDKVTNFSKTTDHSDKYSFLLENKKGMLGKLDISKDALTPRETIMYKIHRNTTSKLSKLRSLLKNERAHSLTQIL
uniref:THAP-type domain-containing protein n=1 Tax=Anoplophora glabripennis TaxID=217634 RepID=V5GVS1_ANOGL